MASSKYFANKVALFVTIYLMWDPLDARQVSHSKCICTVILSLHDASNRKEVQNDDNCTPLMEPFGAI